MSDIDQALKTIADSKTVEEMADALREWGEAAAKETPGTTPTYWIGELYAAWLVEHDA